MRANVFWRWARNIEIRNSKSENSTQNSTFNYDLNVRISIFGFRIYLPCAQTTLKGYDFPRAGYMCADNWISVIVHRAASCNVRIQRLRNDNFHISRSAYVRGSLLRGNSYELNITAATYIQVFIDSRPIRDIDISRTTQCALKTCSKAASSLLDSSTAIFSSWTSISKNLYSFPGNKAAPKCNF